MITVLIRGKRKNLFIRTDSDKDFAKEKDTHDADSDEIEDVGTSEFCINQGLKSSRYQEFNFFKCN